MIALSLAMPLTLVAIATAPAPTVTAVPVQNSPIALRIGARSGSQRLVCAIDGRTPRTCRRTASLKAAPGRHRISVWAIDQRGRSSARRTVVVIVPQRAPAAVAVGSEPVGIASADGSIWISNGSAGTVSRLDATSRVVTATIALGDSQLGSIAATSAAVWVSSFGAGALVRIDPARNQVVGRIQVGGQPAGVSIDPDGDVWVTNLDGSLARIDPATDHVVARTGLPAGASIATFARGLLWIGLQDGSLVALDTATNALVGARIHVAADVDAIVDTPDGLWVSTFAGQAALVDPGTRRVLHRVTLPGRGSGIAFAGGSVWASVYDHDLLVRLTPGAGALVSAVHTGRQPRESVVAGGALWVLDEGAGTVTPVPLPAG